ncbi:ABC transporter permease subunit [Nonomuraea sp. NPDC048826]|uniref:ABC transporter permease subunit n=1 Tax=Nonomuraea sp. NPDC048826 TaxID=3364347 RepID=UPI00371028C2
MTPGRGVRRPPARRRVRIVTWLLLSPALLLIGFLLVTIAVFAWRSAFPEPGGQLGALGVIENGAVDGFFWTAMLRTVLMAFSSAVVSCLISLAVAAALVAVDRPLITTVTSIALFSPLVVSLPVRGYGWFLILDQKPVQDSLNGIAWLFDTFGYTYAMVATVIVMAHAMMPLTSFPVIARLREIHHLRLEPAARDMGAGAVRAFRTVTLPLALPTLARVLALGTAMAMGAYGIPAIIGRGRVQVVAELIYQNLLAADWSSALVRLLALLAVTGVIVAPLYWGADRLGRRMAVNHGGAG